MPQELIIIQISFSKIIQNLGSQLGKMTVSLNCIPSCLEPQSFLFSTFTPTEYIIHLTQINLLAF